ncbi:MAG: (Fe-S)-binding protein, partial [Propionibacterium sp.]|nr:(Fe-S)-binding protein [Propionibacterium sp.]
MAAYKARVIHESYKGRLRPRDHYALGWLPRWGRLMTKLPMLPGLVNAVGAAPVLGNALKFAAGVDARRQIPRFAKKSAKSGLAKLVAEHDNAPRTKGRVLLWVDSFTDCFESNTFAGMVHVLLKLGYEPEVLSNNACCGLTWISTGQLDGARRQIRGAARVLAPYVAEGVPIVGLEPSCTAVWRSDAPELLPNDANVAALNGTVLTLAEFLERDDDFTPPDLSGHTIVAQPHCHQASVVGWQADRKLLEATGAKLVSVGGCCGLAGNFGVERGHHEVSVKVFENDLGPAIEAHPDAIVLADGFSCQTQLRSLADRGSMSLAELLATH